MIIKNKEETLLYSGDNEACAEERPTPQLFSCVSDPFTLYSVHHLPTPTPTVPPVYRKT